jgi:hypothetical protein
MEKRSAKSKPVKIVLINSMEGNKFYSLHDQAGSNSLSCKASLGKNKFLCSVRGTDVTITLTQQFEIY